MRVFLFAMIALLAMPVLVVGGWLAYQTWREHAFKENTPLAANLNGGWNSMRARFRDRVRQKFPPGTPVDQVVAELRAQGFKDLALRDPGLVQTDPEARAISALPRSARMSVHDETGFVCDFDWIVGWDMDEVRHVKLIFGDLRGICL